MSDYKDIPSPCYVLEEDKLIRNLETLAATADAAGVEIIPALKGFALWGVFPLVGRYVKGAAASSLNEAKLIAEEMGKKAHTYAPVFREEEIDSILDCSSHITFNSAAQVRRFLPRLKARRQGREISWGLRINPGYSPVETALYNPASPESRLGASPEELEDLLRDALPEGLHLHALCESEARHTVRLIEAVEESFGEILPRLRWLNLGGGHLITRAGYDRELLIRSLAEFRERYPNLRVYLEPGSAFAWETGFLRARVEDLVRRGDVETAILDVSFTAHMPDCLEMPYQPQIRGLAIAESAGSGTAADYRYRMGGNSCLAGDVMGDWLSPKALSVGDPIIFEDMIHYTMVKTTMFNGVHHPSIGILASDGTLRIVREFGYADYRDRLS